MRLLAVPAEGSSRPEDRRLSAASGSGELFGQLLARLDSGARVDSTLAPLICAGLLGEPGPLVEARHALERWAAKTGLSPSTVADLVLSSYEALANAAEHAYPSGYGPVDLVAARTIDGRVLVSVSDRGRWRPPPADPGFRGRGILMIKTLAHRAEIRQGTQGTTVHMEWALPAAGSGSRAAYHD